MEFRKLYDAVYDEVQNRLGNDGGCHDFDHTLRVVWNAIQLCKELPEADQEIVLLAALLHDVARSEEDRSKGAVDHAERGAAMVPAILAPYGLPQEQIRRIAEAVRTHRFRGGDRPATLEAEIVYDADKLDSLGAVGIGRAFLFAGKEGARLHNDAKTALNSNSYSKEDTAYREYLVKLRKLPSVMLTRPAWEIAQSRAAFMKQFFKNLNQETDYRSAEKMKLECPYCWQHYEVAKSDMNRELVCINCEQSFRVQDALIIDANSGRRNYTPWLIAGMGVIIIVLLIVNVWIWRSLSAPRTDKENPRQTAVAAQQVLPAAQPPDPKTAAASLYMTQNDFRAENEKLQKQVIDLEQARQVLTARLEKAEKQLAANSADKTASATEESVNNLSIKVESANAQIQLLNEYHKQLLKGLTGLRQELIAMNLADRLNNLEKKAVDVDPEKISRRLDKLEALVNTMRTNQ